MSEDVRPLPGRGWRANPLTYFAVIATVMFVLMAVGLTLWPGDDGTDWLQILANTVVLAAALTAGRFFAIRRYGREALIDEHHPHANAAQWSEIGVMALVAAIGVIVQRLLF